MYKIIISNEINQNFIYFHSLLRKQENILSDKIVIHFGMLKKELTIKYDDSLQPECILIPKKITERIDVPDLPYDCYFKENHLFLGPVIGFIPQKVYFYHRKKMMLRFSTYNSIKGLIFIFRPKGIDAKNEIIEGLYFDPKIRDFVEGTFPYPGSIFNRSFLKYRNYQKLPQCLKGKIFYNYNVRKWNKWAFWSLLHEDEEINRHLPDTMIYKDLESLLEMLEKHKSIYLKPVNLSRGRGILHLQKSNAGYLLTDINSNSLTIGTEEDLMKTLEESIRRKYIIQQEISSKNENQKIDFRAYFFKNQNKEWYYAGMETKIADKGSIISNFKNRKDMMPGDTALKEIYLLSPEEINILKKRLIDTCIKCLTIIENKDFHLGEAAVDIVIDANLKFWLLEVQTYFAAEKKAGRSLAEEQILPVILPAPFQYAKALAGFPATQDD